METYALCKTTFNIKRKTRINSFISGSYNKKYIYTVIKLKGERETRTIFFFI